MQVGGDAILKALAAAEYNAPDAEASAPVLQAFLTVIRSASRLQQALRKKESYLLACLLTLLDLRTALQP